MIEIKENEVEKAILVGLKTRSQSRAEIEENVNELERLAETAGAEVLFKIFQEKDKRDPAFFIGKGKAEEIAELAEMNEVSLIIFDDDLTQTQVRNLEKVIDKKIIDRSGLILDIFASHAKTNEAKTQVELAQLEYMLPRLTRAWTHLSKQYGGIGTKGPGETQIETDRRIIRTRIGLLKNKLKKIEAQQLVTSTNRDDFITASLVGYTNAGKSTLLNLLTGADVLAENKLFATLDSTTRILELESGNKILLSDTVGFIRKLPHNLIASFRSTLNVVKQADLILHIVDISHQAYEDQIDVVNSTLKLLNCEDKPQLIVFNKVDALQDKAQLEYVRNKYQNHLAVSAVKGMNITGLLNKLNEFYEKNYITHTFELPIEQTKLISSLHDLSTVINQNYEENKLFITIKASELNFAKIKKMIDEKKNINN